MAVHRIAQRRLTVQKRREDACALPKLPRNRTGISHRFRTKCFWSAMRLRIAFQKLRAFTKRSTCDRNSHARELAARAATLFYASRHLHHYGGNAPSKAAF